MHRPVTLLSVYQHRLERTANESLNVCVCSLLTPCKCGLCLQKKKKIHPVSHHHKTCLLPLPPPRTEALPPLLLLQLSMGLQHPLPLPPPQLPPRSLQPVQSLRKPTANNRWNNCMTYLQVRLIYVVHSLFSILSFLLFI